MHRVDSGKPGAAGNAVYTAKRVSAAGASGATGGAIGGTIDCTIDCAIDCTTDCTTDCATDYASGGATGIASLTRAARTLWSRNRTGLLALALAVLPLLTLLAPAPAHAGEAWPSKPIHLIIPFPPGGGTDVIGRVLAQHMSESLGQPVVADNRVGASGIIGTNAIAKAAPDGYTIGLIISSHWVNPALFKSLPYDSVKDFAPVSLIGYGLFALVTHPSVPASNVRELIALAQKPDTKLNIGIASIGTIGHLAHEQLKALYKTNMTPVVYKGAGPAVADLLGGHIQVMFSSYPSVQQHIGAGKLRGLAVTSAKRSPVAPSLPTAVEMGADGLVLSDWWGLVAPAGTDRAIVNRYYQEVRRILAIADVQKRLMGLGAEIVGNTPEEFNAMMAPGVAKWSKVIVDAGIKPE